MVEIKKGWYGVDLDGTLFTYDKWVGWNVFGKPIQPMIDRVLAWLAEGKEVKIVTARVGLPLRSDYDGFPKIDRRPRNECLVTGQMFSDSMMVLAIQDHCARHGLPQLPVQCYKDVGMIELWDDRAVQVVPNTGRTLAEEHEARTSAARGKVAEEIDLSHAPGDGC